MALVRTITYADTVLVTWSDEDPDTGEIATGFEWRSGTPEELDLSAQRKINSNQQQRRLQNILAVLESNYSSWASLSAAQKDTADRNAQRAVATLIRQQLQDLDSPGV